MAVEINKDLVSLLDSSKAASENVKTQELQRIETVISELNALDLSGVDATIVDGAKIETARKHFDLAQQYLLEVKADGS